jgi:hypothetical protein
MSSFDLTSPVVRELRAAKPHAPEALRERVLSGAGPEPEARFTLPSWFTVRRVALVAVPACLAVAVGGALIHGIANSGSPGRQVVLHGERSLGRARPPVFSAATPTVPTFDSAGVPQQRALALPAPKAKGDSTLAPSRGRLQDYRASLTVRVDGLDALSPSTQKAMHTARALGGYVVSAHYGAAKQGQSELVFRIPITRIQQAIARFSALGTISAQDIQITDLQRQYNQQVKQINSLRVAIAKVDDKLANPSLSNADRVVLQQQRKRLVATFQALTTAKGQTVKRARLATVSLMLTTERAAVPVKPQHQGPLGRAFDDAGSILAKEVSWGLYALVVLGPLAVLALLAYIAIRLSRRYADRRLLESS